MIRFFAALVLLAAYATPHAQTVDGTLKKILESKTITIAHRTDALPFSYEDNGKQPAGYTVDLCKRVVASIERQLKVPALQIKWVPATSQNRLELVRTGKADMECGATTVTLTRMGQVDFSSHVFVDTTGMLVRGSAARSFKDLAGKRIAVIARTTNHAALNETLKKQGIAATVVQVKDRDEAVAALEGGKVDAFANDKILLLGMSRKMKDPSQFLMLDDDLSYEPYAIVLPRGDAGFRLAVNRALSEIYSSGAIGEIFRRAFGPEAAPSVPMVIMYGLGTYPD